MNNHGRRNKPGPKLSLSGFFNGDGSGSSDTANGRTSTTINPSQLKPTRIIDANPPSDKTSGVIHSFERIPVIAVVRHSLQEGSSREGPNHLKDAAKQPDHLSPLKYIITFPIQPKAKESIKAMMNELEQDRAASVEIQYVRQDNGGGQSALDDSEWQELADLVDILSGFGASDGSAKGTINRSIIIAGILPPPLHPSYPSSRLHTAHPYADIYLPRLTELSLVANVSLKLLPPVMDDMLLSASRVEDGQWWADEEELKRVMRLYVTPAMECFGSHRLVFGSSAVASPEVPTPNADSDTNTTTENNAPLIGPERWYVVAKTMVSELVCGSGDLVEAQTELDNVFSENASRIWRGPSPDVRVVVQDR